jgi:hypothetical protein
MFRPLAILLVMAAASAWAESSEAPKVSLDQLAPRPPAPAPSDQPKGDGLNPMLKQKRVPRAGKKSKTDIRVQGAASNGYGAGAVRTKVGEF